MKDKLLMSANLLLTTVDDSARRVFEVGSDRLGAVMGHKCVVEHQCPAFFLLIASHPGTGLRRSTRRIWRRTRRAMSFWSMSI